MFDSPLETDVVCYGETSISFTVLRIARRKSLAIEVHPDMRVLVRCPADCDEDTIRGRVTKRARWITRQQRYFAQFQPLPSARQYVSGETHFYLGRRYRLRVRRGDQPTVRIVGDRLVVSALHATPRAVADTLSAWLRERAKSVFAERLALALPQFSKTGAYSVRLAVRHMHKRWASLSEANRLTVNQRLVTAPKSCIDYVLVHELCHLHERNHGKGFYRMLNRLMPDWQRRKQHLEQFSAG